MEFREAKRASASGLIGAVALGCLLLPGCNLIDVALGRDAKIEKMIPGGNVATGQLDCWLTLNFARLPSGIDAKDVRVRFESIALVESAEYDWAYIANHDFVVGGAGAAFGSGHVRAEHTTPDQPPELNKPTKVRFPLKARDTIENAPDKIYLHATLYWGGKKQHSSKRMLEHVYASTPGGFL